MAWSKNILTYPAEIRELFTRLVDSGSPSTHSFPTPKQASHFERMIQGVRYSMAQDKDSPYYLTAPGFTTERVDPLTVRLCSTSDTERGKLAAMALAQRKEQDEAQGISFPGDEFKIGA